MLPVHPQPSELSQVPGGGQGTTAYWFQVPMSCVISMPFILRLASWSPGSHSFLSCVSDMQIVGSNRDLGLALLLQAEQRW